MKQGIQLIVMVMTMSVIFDIYANETKQNPIIVSASRLQEDSVNIPANVTVLTSSDIENSAARTLPDLLGLEAGITSRNIYGNNAARSTIDIRGFGVTSTQNTLILLDGRRLNDVDLSAVDYSAIPLSNIAKIEVIRGGGAVLYGDSAVGGVINIITKQPGDLGSEGSVILSEGTYDQTQLDMRISHGNGPFSFTVNASGIDSAGYRDNNELSQKSLMADMRVSKNNWEWFTKFGGDKQQLGLPGGRLVDEATSTNELEDDRRGTNTPNDFADQDGRFVTSGISLYPTSAAEIIVDLGWRGKTQEFFFDYGSGTGNYTESQLSTTSFTPRAKLRYRLMAIPSTVTFGIDEYYSIYESNRAQNPDTISSPIHQLDVTQQSTAIYLHNTSKVGKSHIIAGARLQQVDLRGSDLFDPTAPGGALDSGAGDLDESDYKAMYELGMKYQVIPTLSLFINVERSVRFATVDELYEYDPITFLRVFSPLDPQTARTLSLGANIDIGRFHIEPALYYMDLKNEIHFTPATFTNENLDPTKRYGAEIASSVKFKEVLGIKLNYSYTRSLFKEGLFEDNDVPMVPRHTASLALFWNPTSWLTVSSAANYIGKKRFDNDQVNTFESIPDYTFVDMKMAIDTKEWRLQLMANNIFDKEVFDYGIRSTSSDTRFNAFPLPERSYTLSAETRF